MHIIMYNTGIAINTLESRFTVASLVSHPCSVPSDRILLSFNKLTVSVKSVIEATQYFLSRGVNYVLTQAFCQDPLEEHFSMHRAMQHGEILSMTSPYILVSAKMLFHRECRRSPINGPAIHIVQVLLILKHLCLHLIVNVIF